LWPAKPQSKPQGLKPNVDLIAVTARDPEGTPVVPCYKTFASRKKQEGKFNKTKNACGVSVIPPIAKSAMDGAPSFIYCASEKPVGDSKENKVFPQPQLSFAKGSR
jgi:hypothetical protein